MSADENVVRLPDRAEPVGGEREDDSVARLTGRLREFRAAREWERFHTPRSLAISISIEAGELLEQFQWVNDEELAANVEKRHDSIREEVADVAIYALQLADVLGMDLAEAMNEKIDLNEARYPVEAARDSSRKYTELTADKVADAGG